MVKSLSDRASVAAPAAVTMPTPSQSSPVAAAHAPTGDASSPQRSRLLFPGQSKKRKTPSPHNQECPSPTRKSSRTHGGVRSTARKVVRSAAGAVSRHATGVASAFVPAATPLASTPSLPTAPRKRVLTGRYRHSVATPAAGDAAVDPPVAAPAASRKITNTTVVNRTAVMVGSLHTWSRPGTFLAKGNNLLNCNLACDLTDAQFEAWEGGFGRQTRHRFRKERVLAGDRDAQIGRGLRSTSEALSLVDYDAATLTTSDAKRLSRYHWEDLLGVQVNDGVIIYFRKGSSVLDGRFRGKPKQAFDQQKRLGIGGETVKLNGINFLVLRAVVETAPLHLAAVSGALTLPKLKDYFKKKDGFVVSHLGTNTKTTFLWKDVVVMAADVYIFGEPRSAARDYGRLFRSVWSRPYAQQIYHNIGQETTGDSFASYALSCAYNICMKNSYKRAAVSVSPPLLSFSEKDNSGQFSHSLTEWAGGRSSTPCTN